MSYQLKKEWLIKPKSSPVVRKNCSKCGKKTHFINSKKFRVNANGKNIDIWLIFNCEHCKSNWNMTIHERVNPKSLAPTLYSKFLSNDQALAEEMGSDMKLHVKNKSACVYLDQEYHIEERILSHEANLGGSAFQEITLKCPLAITVRLDKLLSEQLGLSRSQVQKKFAEQVVLKTKVRDGLVIKLPV